MVQLSGLRYDQLIYIDESAANERSLDRKYGRSPKGHPARLISSAKRSKKWSILPAYTYDGFIDWEIIRGSYNSNMFINFIKEKVIPHTTPFPGPMSVLIMDNAKIHHHLVCLQRYLLLMLHRTFKQYVKMLELSSFICHHIRQTLTRLKKRLHS